VDFDHGGSISYLADPGCADRNLINSFDQGRQVQMSFYAGPVPHNPPTPEHPDGACSDLFRGDWPWNPIGAGDVVGGKAEVLQFERHAAATSTATTGGGVRRSCDNNNAMSIATRPLQWACRNVPCECTFHNALELIPNTAAVKVIATLRNERTDAYDETIARDQELPAMYTNGEWHRLITYNGSQPFQEHPVVEYEVGFDNSQAFPWIPGRFPATENWAALVDDTGWGLGVINPKETEFLGGFHLPERKGSGGPMDPQTGYLAPVSQHALPRNIVFTYEYYLVLGSIDDIRSFAYQIKETSATAQQSDSRNWMVLK